MQHNDSGENDYIKEEEEEEELTRMSIKCEIL